MRTFTIGNNDAGQRIDKFVSKAVPSLSNKTVLATSLY